MQILMPIVHETIWGGSKLTPFSNSTSQRIGHLYSFIDNAHMKSRISHGPDAGKDIHEWFVDNRARYRLEMYEEVPILGALVEARETLSIQVHPDDQKAREIDGLPFGKNESFYTLEAPTDRRMYNGCKAKSVAEVRSMISEGRILEALDTMPCEPGDYVHIEGGTLHAATAGSLHFEIEENCDRTYRFFDFDRLDQAGLKRPLQVENALKCLDVSKKSVSRKYNGEPIEERMYRTQLVRDRDEVTNTSDMFAFAVVVRGEIDACGIKSLAGTAILLDPGDSLQVRGCEVILAWPKSPQT